MADCLICFESHTAKECPGRKPEHCSSCHIFINRLTDHSPICDTKSWIFKPYKSLYVVPPMSRLFIGCNSPFRYLCDGDWRKPFDDLQMCSPESGIIVRFEGENDIKLLTRGFAPIRIAVIVKEKAEFKLKLMLLASRSRFFVAVNLNEPFDRHAAKKNRFWKTTLILTVAATQDLCLAVMLTPPRQLVRRFELLYDQSTKKFAIPIEMDANAVSKFEMKCQPPPPPSFTTFKF